jgi:predicted nuclease of restriction endonuclease-like (RecB) superfamily
MTKAITKEESASPPAGNYSGLIGGISELLDAARRTSVRAVNALMTASYWEIGRRIVEFEQGGRDRARYGSALVERLATDLTARLGRGFSRRNVFLMRAFYLACPQPVLRPPSAPAPADPKVQTLSALSDSGTSSETIVQTPSAQSEMAGKCPTLPGESSNLIRSAPSNIFQTSSGIFQTPAEKSAPFDLADLARAFPLPWSHYVLLTRRSRSPEAFAFYHTEALRGGWSVRQLQRQIDSQFYERTALSRNKAAMLAKGAKPQPGDVVSADEEIRHPLVLEFLGLRDEYSETDLEDALIRHLETFLLELGNDFAFIGRQRRLRLDDEWYRVDLLFFHRRLRCLVIFDLSRTPTPGRCTFT